MPSSFRMRYRRCLGHFKTKIYALLHTLHWKRVKTDTQCSTLSEALVFSEISSNPGKKDPKMKKGAQRTRPTHWQLISTPANAFLLFHTSAHIYISATTKTHIHSFSLARSWPDHSSRAAYEYECYKANMLSTESFIQVNNKTNFHKFILLLYTYDLNMGNHQYCMRKPERSASSLSSPPPSSSSSSFILIRPSF